MSSILEREVASLQRDRMQTLAQQAARIEELEAALTAMVDEQVDYMTINNLGDPEKQHNIKWARKALKPQESG